MILRSGSFGRAAISAAPFVSEAVGQMLWFRQEMVGRDIHIISGIGAYDGEVHGHWTHREGCLEEAYRRFHEKGRMMPAGLYYIDSWLEKDGDRCFRLMEADDRGLFAEWTKNWDDLTDFEIVKIRSKPTA